MATTEQFSLRWNNFHSNLTSGFHELLEASEMVDVTLAVDGQFLQAHKIVLSICSPLFKQMFKVNPCKHPIVILKDVGHDNMKDILEFMYMGEVNVMRENLPSFLRTAELLQVKGLTGDDSSETSSRKGGKCDSITDEEQDMINYHQLTDSDVELPPSHYTPTRVPTPTPAPSTSPLNSKRLPKNCPVLSPINTKRAKIDNSNHHNNQQILKNESDNHSKVIINSEENSNNYSEDIKSERNLIETEEARENFKNNIRNNNLGIPSQSDPHIPEGKPDTKCTKHTYQCEKCAKKFSRRDHLRTHEKNIHGEDAGPFVCVICSQLYKNTESLRKHLAKFHFPKMTEMSQKVEVKA